jgi:hypothetical protein
MRHRFLVAWIMCWACVVYGQTETKLTASDAAANDGFGSWVSVDGDTAVIGAYGDDDGAANAGSAYVFTRDAGGAWSEQAKLTPADPVMYGTFGCSVSLAGDTAVIGAYGDDDAGAYSGSAYVYTRDAGGSWSEQAKLTAADAEEQDYFGTSVSADGDTAVVGASGDDDAGASSGSAYVYTRDAGGAWSQQAKLTASDQAESDFFGNSVSISGDTVVVGAHGNDDAGSYSGSAYVFTRDAGGAWSEQAKLTASDAAASDWFGRVVSVNGDTAVIGAYGDDDAGSESGAVYVFTRGAGGAWSEQAKLTAADAAASNAFGFSASVNADTTVVGARYGDGGSTDSGAVYVFTRDAGGTWSEQVKLTASDGATNDSFGFSVSVNGDTAVVGAVWDDDAGNNSGSAYVYTGAPIPVELQLFSVE